jgi:hypothetical protein
VLPFGIFPEASWWALVPVSVMALMMLGLEDAAATMEDPFKFIPYGGRFVDPASIKQPELATSVLPLQYSQAPVRFSVKIQAEMLRLHYFFAEWPCCYVVCCACVLVLQRTLLLLQPRTCPKPPWSCKHVWMWCGTSTCPRRQQQQLAQMCCLPGLSWSACPREPDQ